MNKLLSNHMKFLQIAFAMFAALSFTACSNDDDGDLIVGDWEPMEWVQDQDGKDIGDHVYVVPQSGGVYQFTCKNYSPWISSCWEKFPDGTENKYSQGLEGFDWRHMQGDWFEATIPEKQQHQLTIAIKENTTGSEREYGIIVTGGDIFDYFCFKQKAN